MLIAADVAQLGHFTHGADQARRPGVQRLQVVALQRELILRVAGSATEAHVLHGLEIERGPRHLRELWPETRDDVIRGDLSLFARLQRDESAAGVRRGPAAAAASREQGDRVDRGIGFQDFRVAHHLFVDGRERDILLSDDVDGEASIVLLGEEALRHDVEEVRVHREGGEEDDHGDRGMEQRDGQRPVVRARDGVEESLTQHREPRAVERVLRPEQEGAHHRGRRERDRQRHQDRDREHHGELTEETPHDAAHQQNGNEHGHEREAHRQHREADLLGAGQCGLEHRRAALDLAHDVLDHDDGVVDDKAGGDGQRHQRKVVDAVPDQIHDREGADQGDRHDDAGNDRRADVSEEHEDDEHDETDRDQERFFDILDGCANGHGLVEHRPERDFRRHEGAQIRQLRADPVDGLDDVDAGLAVDDEDHGGLAVGHRAGAEVFDGAVDSGHVDQPHGRAVSPRDDQRLVARRLAELIRGIDLPGESAVVELALGTVDVRGRQHLSDLVEADAVARERQRIQVYTDGRQGAAADEDLPDAFEPRDLLLQDRGGDVVHPPLVHGLRSQSEDQDRRVRRVRLPVRGQARQVRRELTGRRGDRRLDVPRGAVDVARQVELERDRRGAQEADGRHLRNAGDAPELTLERRGDGGRHRLGARAGQTRDDGDRREVHLWQRRDREQPERDRPRDDQRDGQQCGADGPADERAREAHGAVTGCPARLRSGARRRASRSARRSNSR